MTDAAEVAARPPPSTAWAVFVRAARPTGMWVCVLALFVNLVLIPISWLMGMKTPAPDWAQLVVLAVNLVGLGAMRSLDKLNGTAT